MGNLRGKVVSCFVSSAMLAGIVVACGSDESAAPPPSPSSSSSGAASSSGGSSGAGSSSGGSSGASSGDSGVDAGPKCGAEGAACTGGSCTHDVCRPDVTISADTNLSTDPVTAGRTCAAAIAYSVTGLTATTATTSDPIAAGCIEAGDEILVINLQGTPTVSINVGVFENLRVASVSGSTVTFDKAKTKFFGDVAGDDANVGTAADKQKVMLMRVPNFGKLTVEAGKTVTAAPWNGLVGGVVAFRTNALTLAGTIDARLLGYRGGRWSRDDSSCSENVQTEAGESIGGPGGETSNANGGGSGGIGVLAAVSFNGNDPLTGSAGHASAGQAGANFQGRTASAPGAAYGVADGSKLTMGSGGGGNLTCDNVVGPTLVDVRPRGGGIVAVFGGNVTVNATGIIDSGPPGGDRSVSSAGYVLIRGDVVDFTAGKVQAKQVPGSAVSGTYTNMGSEGRIAVLHKTSVAGTATPAAFTQQIANP